MKRRLFKLVVFLLLGTVINVAVAWGCAAWIDIDYLRDESAWGIDLRDGNDWLLLTIRSQGAMSITSIWSVNWEPFFNKSTSNTARSLVKKRFAFVHPTDQQQLELPDLARVLTAYGWPKLTLWSGCQRREEAGTVPSSGSWTITTGLRITGEQSTSSPFAGLAVPRTLPLRPIWPGFAINTIFYAAILWLLTLGPFTARRVIRHKRGCCIKCGYDLRGAEHEACPECGCEVCAGVKP